jgi:hypothetical protein
MRIYFTCKTNKECMAINSLVFTLPNGVTVKVDRDETDFDFEGNVLTMVWKSCYLWSVDDCNIFGFEGKHISGSYELSEFKRFIQGATYDFELEEDAGEDYKVTILQMDITQ